MIDLSYLNEDPDYPCIDDERHDYRDDGDGTRFECGRCGAEVMAADLEPEEGQ